MDHGHGRSLLTALTCNAAVAVYGSWGNPASVAFVVVATAYAAMLLLLHFLRGFERAPPAGADRSRAKKAAVWALSTLLTAMFASRVALLMPPLVAVGVWVMAAATVGGGFWAMFC